MAALYPSDSDESLEVDGEVKGMIIEMLENMWEDRENLPPVTPIADDSKQDSKANVHLVQGNMALRGKDYANALMNYNTSLTLAIHPEVKDEDIPVSEDDPIEDPNISFPKIDITRYGGFPKNHCVALFRSYANRAHLLFEMNAFEKCIQDIDMALDIGSVSVEMEGLKIRKRKCLEVLHPERFRNQNAGETPEHVHAERREQRLDRESKALRDLINRKPPNGPTLIDRNRSFPSFSNAVIVSDVPYRGRKVVAKRYIRPGEILGIERVSIVGRDDKDMNCCSTCLVFTMTPIPCPRCSEAVFCSKACRIKGLKEDHWVDCKLFNLMRRLNLGEWTCIYQLMKNHTYSQYCEMMQRVIAEQLHSYETMRTLDDGNSAIPLAVPLLQGDEEFCHPNSYGQRTRVCYGITKLLEQSERFFVDDNGIPYEPNKEEYLNTTRIVMRHTIRKLVNSFAFRCGTVHCWGIGLAFSLLSHSCAPNARIDNCGRLIYLFSLKPIQAGKEVKISHTQSFEELDKEDRRRALRKYRFNCECIACVENWPVYEDLPHLELCCLNCRNGSVSEKPFICRDCLEVEAANQSRERLNPFRSDGLKITMGLENFQRILIKMVESIPITNGDYRKVRAAVEILNKYGKPCQLLCDLKDLLVHCQRDLMQQGL